MATIDNATRAQLVELYVAYFNRAPDSNGLAYWANEIASGKGWTVETVARSFMDQDEVKAMYPAYMTSSEIVDKVYNNVLNRDADAAGKAYWVDQLNTGKVTKADLIQAVVNAAKSSTGTPEDAAVLANKTTVGEYFATKGLNDTTAAAAIMAMVTGDAASVAAANAATDNFAETGSTGREGQTYHLTTAQDTINGTAGNDTIVATDTTLTPGDRIDGKGGVDNMQYFSSNNANHSAFTMTNVERVAVTADNNANVSFDMSGTTGADTLASVNSTGNVTFDQVTAVPHNVEVNTVTTGGNVTVRVQDSCVLGANDTVNLNLINNYNAGVGTITMGNMSANQGIETVNINTSLAASTVAALDVNMTNLNIAGDQNLSITTALNGTERNIDASGLNANLNLVSTATGNAAVTYVGAQGNDTVTFAGTTGNHTISTGAGNDIVTLGMGDDVVDLGAGDDLLIMAAGALTVNDTITGGEGKDTIQLAGGSTVAKSEAEKVTGIEVFDLRGAGSTVVITDNLVNTLSTGYDTFTVTTEDATGDHTIDLTNLSFSNTNKFALAGSANNETVIMDDATVNAKAVLDFGAGNNDKIIVMDGATMTADDFSNITGLEQIELKSVSNVPQTWNIELSDALVGSSSIVAPGATKLVIWVDSNVPAGSVVNVNTNNLGVPANLVEVRTNANTTVNVTGTGAANVTVLSTLEYTLNPDNLIGTAGNDLFVADSVAKMQVADNADGLGGNDTLRMDFAVFNAAASLESQLNNTSINNIENLVFNTDNAVRFDDALVNGAGATLINGVDRIATGAGNDVVNNAATFAAATVVNRIYDLGEGNNTYNAGAAAGQTVNTGSGNDTFAFTTTASLKAGDIINAGAGTDTLNLTDAVGGVYGLMTAALSGIDVVNYTAANAAAGLTINNAAITQADAGLTVNVTDGTAAANTAAIFDASAVTTGNSVVVNVTGAGAGQALNAADVIGGAGNDTITIGGTVTGYVVQANAGADTINLTTANAVSVLFNSPNDGSASGSVAVYDTITGFTSGTDVILFNNATFLATDAAGTGAVTSLVVGTNAPVNFTTTENALVMTQAGTGFTNADLLDLSAVASRANTIGVTAAATQGGIIVAQGQTQSAVYLYVEADGTANNVTAGEMKLLGIVDTNALGNAATDLAYA